MANENIQELKFQVGEAWKGVYSSSTAYGLANVVQDPTGLSVYRSLKSGNVGHPLSNASWWFRIIDLSSIKAESDRIAALNQAIAQDEALRVAAEELRQQHEAERVAAETQRNEAEQQRISAEEQRVNKESQREAAEQQRITAEQGRVSAESARVQAEQARVLAETLRANAEDQRAANEQNRVAAEQQRIERAEQDHQRAESDHATYVDSLGAFDISSYHATDGVLAKYADLTAALGTGGANIPDDLRKGGMSVKFVQSSDNNYVQYRLIANSFTTNVAQWQEMDMAKKGTSSNIIFSTLPDISSSDNTLTLKGGTDFILNDKTRKYVPQDVVIDFSETTSNFCKIIYNTVLKEFRALNWDVVNSITVDDITIATICKIPLRICSGITDYTIDGKIPIIAETYGSDSNKTLSQNFLSKKIKTSAGIMFIGKDNYLPNINTSNNTIDFGGGSTSSLIIGGIRYPTGDSFRAVSLRGSISSRAVKLVFDINSNTFSNLAYSTDTSDTQIVIGTFVFNESYGFVEIIDLPFDYTIDGHNRNVNYEPTNNIRINKGIKGLYLAGANRSKTYFIKRIRRNTSNLFHVIVSLYDNGTETEVASYKKNTAPTENQQLIELTPENSSGISGYCYIDWSAFHDPFVETFTQETATIQDNCFNIQAYPAIYSMSNILHPDPAFDDNVILPNLRNLFAKSSRLAPTDNFALLWFSDLHGNKANLTRIVQFKNKYSQYITDAIHTGDIVRDNISDDFTFWNSSGAGSILNVIGNHDDWISGTEHASAAACYERYLQPFIADWVCVYQADLCYYYKDYTTQGIRLIVLDNMHWDSTQLNWFVNTALNTNLCVIVAMHYQPFEPLSDIPWNSVFSNAEYTPDDIPNAIATFKNNGGKFACYITGHVHTDKFGIGSTYNNQICIEVSTASYTASQDSVRSVSDETMDLFNILSVDATAGILKVMRVGCKINSAFQYKSVLSYDFVNNKVIYSL